jgi:hypothetical protein
MLFMRRFIKPIREGLKTETRRLRKSGETITHNPTTVRDANGRIKWQAGRVYAMQDKRGCYAIGRIRILDITEAYLYPISPESAHAEGFDSPQGFYDVWKEINGYEVVRGDDNTAVWVIAFEYVQGSYEIDEPIAKIKTIGKSLKKHFGG